jgi:fructose-bisphosphate aldolase class II
VPVDEIAEGITNAVRKVNIDTELRMASTGAIRKHLAGNPKSFARVLGVAAPSGFSGVAVVRQAQK